MSDKDQLKICVEAMTKALHHCGWAQTQVSAKDARACAKSAAEELSFVLTRIKTAQQAGGEND